MQITPPGEVISGYKIVNDDMTCRGFKYEVGVWHEHSGEIELCGSGFHFCPYPSGVWQYYTAGRVFEVEAKEVLKEIEPGASSKYVAKKIRLISEVFATGDKNTGDRNTGDKNTGDKNTGDKNTGNKNTGNKNTGNSNTGNRNTGNSNTGNKNTGDSNTGDKNTGDSNTGDKNTGDKNTGNRNTGNKNTGNKNTGNSNTGNRNTGNSNTGDKNTGDKNTGDKNTGDFNYCNKSTGFFNTIEVYLLFDENCSVPEEKLPFSLMEKLHFKLKEDEDFSYKEFLMIPNATVDKIKSLHEVHKAAARDELVTEKKIGRRRKK